MLLLGKHWLKCVKADLRSEKEQSRTHVFEQLCLCVCERECFTPQIKKKKAQSHRNGCSLVYLPFSLSTKQYTSYFSAGSRTPYVLTPARFSRSPVHPGRGSVIGYLEKKTNRNNNKKKTILKSQILDGFYFET